MAFAQRFDVRQVGAGETAYPLGMESSGWGTAITEYRLGYQNFYVITRYNKSTFYASAVMDLAAALR